MSQDELQSETGEGIPYAIGRYRLVEKIGEGATGVVYLAVDTGLGREVAVKLLHAVMETPPFDEWGDRERFSHENLVKVYDRGNEGGHPYAVMEWLDGETLKKTLERGGSVLSDEAARIVAEVGKAVASAHQQGLVHGDIQPGSVFVCGSGQVKLLDLGLALLPRPVDPRWDVFSLGALLYELTAGRSSGKVDSLVATIAEKAMAKRAQDRYQRAVELVQDLERISSAALEWTPKQTERVPVFNSYSR